MNDHRLLPTLWILLAFLAGLLLASHVAAQTSNPNPNPFGSTARTSRPLTAHVPNVFSLDLSTGPPSIPNPLGPFQAPATPPLQAELACVDGRCPITQPSQIVDAPPLALSENQANSILPFPRTRVWQPLPVTFSPPGSNNLVSPACPQCLPQPVQAWSTVDRMPAFRSRRLRRK